MIRHKITGVALFILCSLHCFIYSQSSLNTSGGVATGNTGSVSYSVGQVFYHQADGNEFYLHQGVQIPFEIFNITPIAVENEALRIIKVYPNPTQDLLVVATDQTLDGDLTLFLMDIKGRKVVSKKILSDQTHIYMQNYLPGAYILIIRDNISNTEIKRFKIIKTR